MQYHDLSKRDKRSLIFHLLYMAESHDYEPSLDELTGMLHQGFAFELPVDSEVIATAQEIIEHRTELDEQYRLLLANWRLERLSIPTKLILRYGTWELTRTDLDPTIVINEAVELAKCFAEDDAYKFINGILDELLKKLKLESTPEALPQND